MFGAGRAKHTALCFARPAPSLYLSSLHLVQDEGHETYGLRYLLAAAPVLGPLRRTKQRI